jgi:hypothetical protein
MGLGVVNIDIGSALERVVDAATRWIPDANEKLKAQEEVRKQLHEISMAQIQTNIEQAKSTSVFVAGARPFIMWVCGIALAWTFILAPIIRYIYPSIDFPPLEYSELSTVLMALLGLGGFRTVEKIKGVA